MTALVVIILAGGTATALIATSHSTGDQHFRSEADSVAAQDQDRLRGLSDEQLGELGTDSTPYTVNLNGMKFSVTSTAAFQDAQGNSSCGSGAVDYYKTTSTVTWLEPWHGPSDQSQTVSAESLLSRPVTGTLETSVQDETGAGVDGASITASPTGTQSNQAPQTAVTDSNGCALIAGLQAGPYSLTVEKTNYVDKTGTSPTLGSTSVTTSGTPTVNAFTLGLAGAINATFSTYQSGAVGEADGISYQGAGTTTTQTSPAVAPIAASRSLTAPSLFPFNRAVSGPPSYTNNWTVYAGRCPYQDPPAAADQTEYTVGEGATVTQASQPTTPGGGILEPLLALRSVTGTIPVNGKTPVTASSVQPTDIVVTYSDGGCTDQYAATVASPASGSGIGATPPTNGWLANPGQPYAPSGDVTICADYAAKSGNTTNWYSGATGTNWGNTSMSAANAAPAITLVAGSRCAGVTP